MKEQLTALIIDRLNDNKELMKKAFTAKHSFKVARHFVLDDLLPTDIAMRIYASFPKEKQMHLLQASGKIKLKYAHLKETALLLQDINAAIQDPHVVALIEEITGVEKQIPDPTRFAGGISTLFKGYYINPHVDNSHDVEKKQYYRTMNVLYYVSPNWQLENGGHYQLWDESIENHLLVPSFFNRLVVMETNRSSWHAVSPVLLDAPRCCVFNYYFSEQSPEGLPYFFNKPSFKPRPEQTIRRFIDRVKRALFR